MRIIITGGTGLIGSALVGLLARHDDEILVLSRDSAQAKRHFSQMANTQVVGWDARTSEGWGRLVTAECAIVNLAGCCRNL